MGGLLFVLVSLLTVASYNSFIPTVRATSKVHIVYMGERQHSDPKLVSELHHEMLASVTGSKETAANSMIYSYKHGFSGFAAKLTDSQAEKVSGLTGVIHVMPNHFYTPQTTRSWDYLGQSLNSDGNLLHKANKGDGVIVGVFDTGVWPETETYNDEGLGPIPSRWNGYCESGEQFNGSVHCNKKLIGAKGFVDGLIAEYGDILNSTAEGYIEFLSPRDSDGHGTLTSSVAAGSSVANASYKGLAGGVVRGGAPLARIAMYKPCWKLPPPASQVQCVAADVLKAFDEAIHDGVDVISLSLTPSRIPLFSSVDQRDWVGFGAFHAVAKGISVVCSAGNNGPYAQTVLNTAPWMLNVAATTIDRSFPTMITLGNNITMLGQSIFTGNATGFTDLSFPESSEGLTLNSYCESFSPTETVVQGKMVLCFAATNNLTAILNSIEAVRQAGGVGLIVARNPGNVMVPLDDFPFITVDYELGTQILYYIRSTRSPVIKIGPSKTLTGKPVSTKVADFSSRGPNSIAPAILKPDIAAPGTCIVTASAPLDAFFSDGFTLQSGTSIAAPHMAGIVALLRALHPGWSPATIKSAIVTTASMNDPFGEPIFAEGSPKKLADPFDYGGGLVNPDKAAEPGLVYDMDTNDYIHCLCAMGYNDSGISNLVGTQTNCPENSDILDVNLPSITIPNLRKPLRLTRTVTNVGPVNSIYKALIEPPFGVAINVRPEVLVFNSTAKTISFEIVVSTTHKVNTGYYFGSMTWTDGVHFVTSPVSVRTQIMESYAADF